MASRAFPTTKAADVVDVAVFTRNSRGSKRPAARPTFRCALAKKHKKHKKPKFKRCSSPKTYKQPQAGAYVFEVRAIAAGGPDPTPASKKFKIR